MRFTAIYYAATQVEFDDQTFTEPGQAPWRQPSGTVNQDAEELWQRVQAVQKGR